MPSLTSINNPKPTVENRSLERIDQLDRDLFQSFQSKFLVQASLTRSLVSFQANKTKPVYRWYKYKEAFSAPLVEYLLQQGEVIQGKILDPFAGSGTALFTASELGIDADGIELLPIGQQIINAKKLLETEFTHKEFERLKFWADNQIWKQSKKKAVLSELRITKGAYSEVTKNLIEQYLGACQQEIDQVRAVLQFALLCVLESISYTRKDGQYLRWDYRSGRSQGKKAFNKGEILDFNSAISNKIQEILHDLTPSTQQVELLPTQYKSGSVCLYSGSCLQVMQQLAEAEYDAIITSPPYCNRYDYTRTYALELALLGISAQELIQLRQEMLSCTVENRSKDLLRINSEWKTALALADEQELLQAILKYLEFQKAEGLLNNNGIPRMVKGYFYEMACVIQECFCVLKPGATLFMVNDNVRYAGASISVDLILSDFAQKLGFLVENIWVLPGDKGNSSQQMGNHGRDPLRKCIYVWRKP
ncbi:MAG: site-specific DNA-methyltransferase [Leptolyngbyaceae cyanobacterium SM1_4_3]|nr:site-specific DNA-methyltransferase [Leptolyngbyaceae cyanobacterium SM1_4_3]